MTRLSDEQLQALIASASVDPRPAYCRFRLQDEGKPYPRSSCQGCGGSVVSGLGTKCRMTKTLYDPDTIRALATEVMESRKLNAELLEERQEAIDKALAQHSRIADLEAEVKAADVGE